MRTRTTWCITLFLLCHPPVAVLGLTNELPGQPATPQLQKTTAQVAAEPQQSASPEAVTPLGPQTDPAFTPPAPPSASAPAPDETTAPGTLPAAPPLPPLQETPDGLEIAVPVPPPPVGTPVHIEADRQGKTGDIYTLDGNVLILYESYRIRADHATFNRADSVIIARGHLVVDGGPSNEHIEADHGDMNMKLHTAHLFDATGVVGLRSVSHDRYVFVSPNPFTIVGREVIETGKGDYEVIDGSMTSCRLPDPDWRLLARRIAVDKDVAHARNVTFTLFRVPLFFLPYVSHPVEVTQRQTGILLPIFGNDTQKGFITGEEVYVVLGRSADATIGSEYFSKRGFEPFGLVRYRGRGLDFASFRYRALLDRLPAAENQGGADLFLNTRRQFDPDTRAVTSIEYLSSYVYRQAFEENYSAAINSEVNSNAFLVKNQNAWSAMVQGQRYQNFRSDAIGDEIRVLHEPTLRLDALNQPLGRLPVLWGGEFAGAALSRSEPGFQTSRLTPRLDFYPHLVLPLHAAGWTLRSEAGFRDTFYGKSQEPGAPGDVPLRELGQSLNRAAFTSQIALHPPALERDFSSALVRRIFKNGELRHTIEPELTYNYVTGVNHYQHTLRFDAVDALADTNSIQYGLTQHLYIRHLHPHPCKGDEALGPDDLCGGGTADFLTWTVLQQHYFDHNFGGAVVRGERNVFDATLDLTGVAFLRDPRGFSPVLSRLRMRTSGKTDVEWDLDYDVRNGRVQASNLFASYQEGNYLFSVGDARLVNVTPRVTQLPNAPAPNPNSTSVLNTFNQMHVAAVYGSPTKHGFSAGANVGYDFTLDQTQYLGVETGYNRDCCGLAIEMRRYSLGIVRDDTQYLFSFTLAGIGSVGSLRPVLRVF